MKLFNTFICFLLLSILVMGQLDTVTVYPYQHVTLPKTPLVFFPVTSLSFNDNHVVVREGSAAGPIVPQSEYRVVSTRVFPSWGGNLSNNGHTISFNCMNSSGTNFTATCQAELVFMQPGKTYYVNLGAQPSVNPAQCPWPPPPHPPGQVSSGRKEFLVKVEYPRLVDTVVANNGHLGDFEIGSPEMYKKFIFLASGLEENISAGGESNYEQIITFSNKVPNSNPQTFSVIRQDNLSGYMFELSRFDSSAFICDTAEITVKYAPSGNDKLLFSYTKGDNSINESKWTFRISPPSRMDVLTDGWCFQNCTPLPTVRLDPSGIIKFGFAIDYLVRKQPAPPTTVFNISYDQSKFIQLNSQFTDQHYIFLFQKVPGATIPDNTRIDFDIDYLGPFGRRIQYRFTANVIN